MKSKKETKFTLEKFEEAKLKNLKLIVGGLSGNDPTGGGGRNTNGTQQGGNI